MNTKDSNEFVWDDKTVLEFVNYTLNEAPTLSGRYSDLDRFKEKFKASKSSSLLNKEWGIVSFKTHAGKILTLTNGKYRDELNSIGLSACLNFNWPIHSIRRIYDNSVFTVGDKVSLKIGSFTSHDGWQWHETTLKHITLMDDRISIWGEGCSSSLEGTRHAPKEDKPKPLFRTEDGFDYFPGNQKEYWAVNTNTFQFNNYWSAEWFQDATSVLRFSTKEKLDEWVLLNKPLLSVNDVLKLSQDKNAYISMQKVFNKGIAATVIDNETIINLAKSKL